MIKLRDLARHLRSHDCALLREGASHSVWINRGNGRRTTLPRHRELPRTTAKAICAQLDVPPLA